MRAPKRRRPRRREIYVPPDADLQHLADMVTYEGSPEHKDFPSFAGQHKPRRDASLCPRNIRDATVVTGWLRSAIRAGATGAPWEGGFPRYVWHREGDTVFEGRLVNSGSGSYKGYPLHEDEWPRSLRDRSV